MKNMVYLMHPLENAVTVSRIYTIYSVKSSASSSELPPR